MGRRVGEAPGLLGFSALATTSSGHALTLGLRDQQVSRDQLLAHAESIATAVDVPLNVDAERCFADDPAGVAATARLIGNRDLDEIIGRLVAYRDAGAEVVYAPGLRSPDDIKRVVAQVGAPVNVLALPGGPSVAELAALGVRRISTGGMLAFAAYGALMSAARELQEHGTSSYAAGALQGDDVKAMVT